jgi:general secretion pathway protein H
MARRRTHHHGFTLLELVLVMVIVGAALAMVAPSLRGWNHGSRLRDAATEFAAAGRWARTQAVSTGKVHRLCVDADTGSYWIMAQRGEEFVNDPSSLGQIVTLPDGFRIVLTTDQGKEMEHVEFDPNGSTQPARARIVSDRDASIIVECLSPGERFRVVRPSEQTQ